MSFLGFIYFRKLDIRAIVVFCFVRIYDVLAILLAKKLGTLCSVPLYNLKIGFRILNL